LTSSIHKPLSYQAKVNHLNLPEIHTTSPQGSSGWRRLISRKTLNATDQSLCLLGRRHQERVATIDCPLGKHVKIYHSQKETLG
jgi:hypothetical protein